MTHWNRFDNHRLAKLGTATLRILVPIGLFIAFFPVNEPAEPGIDPNHLTPETNRSWRHPAEIADTHPPISPDYWALDFTQTEEALASLPVDDDNRLALSPDSLPTLRQATSSLLTNPETVPLERVEMLVEKTFPGARGEQLSQLLLGFYQFSRRQQDSPKARELSDLRRRISEQRQYLGKDYAQQLFGESNRLQHYLLLRQQLRREFNQDRETMDRALKELENAFNRGELPPLTTDNEEGNTDE